MSRPYLDIRDDLRCYEHKTHYILKIVKSHLRKYYYDAVILDRINDKQFIIPFGNRYRHIYCDKTGLNSYEPMICNLSATRNDWLKNNSKWLTKGLSKRYLEYIYLFN